MIKPLLVLCDSEEKFCIRMDEYLRSHLDLSFEICSFTEVEKLKEFLSDKVPSLLVISESVFGLIKNACPVKCFRNTLILDETGLLNEEDGALEGATIEHTTKYQSAGRILDQLIDVCAGAEEGIDGLKLKTSTGDTKVLGLFSPLSRCGQTTLAMKMAGELARKGKTILLSFESFSAIPLMMGELPQEDITDLVYYSECEKNKFCLYLEKIKRSCKGVDIIAPAKTAMQIKELSEEKVKKLLELLAGSCGYEYILLDLTEYPSGFFEILRMCDKVFTIVKNGKQENYRVDTYQEVLKQNGYEDVVINTVKCRFPENGKPEALGRYARDLLVKEEILNEGF